MKINRPLMNPTPRQVERIKITLEKENQKQVKKETYKVPKEQLSFGVDTKSQKFAQVFSTTKLLFKRRSDLMEVSLLWKYPSLPLLIVGLCTNVAITLIIIITKYGDFGPKIPFFYNSVEQKWIRDDKEVWIVFPFFLVSIFLLQVSFIVKIFRSDRNLALAISWVMAFLNFLLLITLSQIYFIIT